MEMSYFGSWDQLTPLEVKVIQAMRPSKDTPLWYTRAFDQGYHRNFLKDDTLVYSRVLRVVSHLSQGHVPQSLTPDSGYFTLDDVLASLQMQVDDLHDSVQDASGLDPWGDMTKAKIDWWLEHMTDHMLLAIHWGVYSEVLAGLDKQMEPWLDQSERRTRFDKKARLIYGKMVGHLDDFITLEISKVTPWNANPYF